MIQADFLTTQGRSEFARECLWNDWLADEIYNLIIDRCIPSFLKHDKWRMNFTEILYSLEGGHELFDVHIKKPLRDYLESNAVLIAEDGLSTKAENLVVVTEEIKKLIAKKDFKKIFPKKKILHKDCKPHASLDIESAPEEIHEFIVSEKGNKLMRHKARTRDIKWFKKLYSTFVDEYAHWNYFQRRYYQYNVEHDRFWNRVSGFQIILTKDYSLAKASECYTNPKKINIPKQIKNKFRILHPELVKDESFNKFMKKLGGIGEITKDDIKNTMRKQQTLRLDERGWKKLPKNKKMEKIKHLKELWDTDYLSLEDYNFITIKSKDGRWVRPKNLIFSNEYKPEHNIEVLTGKRLLDLPLKFVSTEFIKDNSEDEIRKWRKFLGELGVDKKVDSEKNKIVQRVAILTALQYEKTKDRSPRELGESEQPGYDIESKSENGDRCIEVKGTSDSSYDIFLTVNEFRTLRNKQDKYFIYVVTDGLRNPILHSIQGDKLLQIEDIKIITPYNKWKDVTDEEFQP